MYYGYGKKKLRLERRAVDRRAASRKIIPVTRFQRVSAQIQNEETGEVISGRVFLHDLNETGVSVFLTAPLRRGERIFIVIEQPRHFFMRGEVAWCALYKLNTRVITAENFQYRAGIRFIYDDAVDRQIVAKYFKSIIES